MNATENIFSQLESKVLGPYIYIADLELRLISVFDELRYDRSDVDMLSPGMRKHVAEKLGKIGFKQTSGTIFKNKEEDIQCVIPKAHALGASPFDIARYTKRREQDFLVLTPTQTACQFVDQYPIEKAVERIKQLISKQPLNIYRLMDYLEDKPSHKEFLQAIGHLKYVQRVAIESEPLCRMRALK